MWGDEVLRNAEEKGEDEEARQLLDRVTEKLHPRRFPRMSTKFAAVLGAMFGQIWTEPALLELVITPDGFLLGRHKGEPTCKEFLGPESWLKENLTKLMDIPGVDLTQQEKEFVWTAYGRIRQVQEPAPEYVH
jgi:hypothetical protein